MGFCSCGDGTLGIPDQKGDNYECRNMKLLLKQQQRVIAFSCLPVFVTFYVYTDEFLSYVYFSFLLWRYSSNICLDSRAREKYWIHWIRQVLEQASFAMIKEY